MSGTVRLPDHLHHAVEWTLRAVACSIRDCHEPGAILDLAVVPATERDQVGGGDHLTCFITLNGGEDEYGWQLDLPLSGNRTGPDRPGPEQRGWTLAALVHELITPWLIRHGMGADLEVQGARIPRSPIDYYAVEIDRACWQPLPEDG